MTNPLFSRNVKLMTNKNWRGRNIKLMKNENWRGKMMDNQKF